MSVARARIRDCSSHSSITFRWLDNRARDFVYAVRTLRKRPGFSLAVIGTLAVGLGLSTAIFTLLNALLLRPWAVRDPHSLYQVALSAPARLEFGFGRSAFEKLRARTDVFTEVLAIDTRFTNLDGRAARSCPGTTSRCWAAGRQSAVRFKARTPTPSSS